MIDLPYTAEEIAVWSLENSGHNMSYLQRMWQAYNSVTVEAETTPWIKYMRENHPGLFRNDVVDIYFQTAITYKRTKLYIAGVFYSEQNYYH